MTISHHSDIRRIAIIGAGPSGLAGAKYLLAERSFDQIVIFEQRATTRGVWNYTPETVQDIGQVPQLDANQPVEKPEFKTVKESNGTKKEPFFLTPMYKDLETNIPNMIMQYSDLPFPKGSQLFPSRDSVTDYLDVYAKDVNHLVKFSTQIFDVRLKCGSVQDTWAVKYKDLVSEHEGEMEFDAVVVANGHYNVHYIPQIEGISEWNGKYPGVISHSKYFRSVEAFKGKKVVVVGNAASGTDIASHISKVCKSPLLHCIRTESYFGGDADPNIEEVPEISQFVPSERTLVFKSGRIEKNIDAVIFCTGYFYSYPFLSSLQPPPVLDGLRTRNTYQHIFYREHPTLAFMTLLQRIIPFQLAEGQAAVIARVWSGRLQLPEPSIMRNWEDDVLEDRGSDKEFHALKFPEDCDLVNFLHDWAMSATPAGIGKIPPLWDEKTRWLRERFPTMRKAFSKAGEARHQIQTPEELGFDYEAWQRENEDEREVEY